jgi:hypothetical protein
MEARKRAAGNVNATRAGKMPEKTKRFHRILNTVPKKAATDEKRNPVESV